MMRVLKLRQASGLESSKGFMRRFLAQWDLQLMVIPWIICIGIFSYIPMYGMIMAFQNYQLGDLPGFSSWAGFQFFQEFFSDSNFWHIMYNTFGMSILKMIFAFPAPIIFAIVLSEIRGPLFKKTVQTITYMPHFVSWVIAAGLFFELLSVDGGIVNTVLVNLHIIKEPIMFFGQSAFFWPIVVISDLWKEVGWNSIIFIAAIAAIDPELYQAADIDGAGRFRKIWHITLAGIKATIVIILIIDISNIVNLGLEQVMLLTNNLKNNMVVDASEIIDTYVYKMGIQLGRYSYASAVGIFKSVLSILFLTFANTFAKKIGEDSLW